MAITAFTGTITATQLNANFDDATTRMATNFLAGEKDNDLTYWLATLASGLDVSLRSFAWTQPDDMIFRGLQLFVTDTGARLISISLTVDNGDTSFLNDETFSLAVTTAIGSTSVAQDYTTSATELAIKLLRGVRYRLTLTNTSGGTVTGPLSVALLLRSFRRRR